MKINLDQLEAFRASAKAGSFSGAARRLGKAQSGISTAISNLEIDLGLTLFDRSGKYPVLTDVGEIFLREAESILSRCRAMVAKADVLAGTTEPRVRLAVSETLPKLAFADGTILDRFQERFPETEVEILSGTLNDVWGMLKKGRIDFGVMMPTGLPSEGWNARFDYRIVGHLDFIPVARPDQGLGGPGLDISVLDSVRQIEVSSRGDDVGPPLPVYSNRVWWVEDEALIRTLLLQGFGWGILPSHLVHDDLKAGRLEKIEVDFGEAVLRPPIIMSWSRDLALGRAGNWLFSAMEKNMAENSSNLSLGMEGG
ncbi:MAG: LysR family transcriptional regulator [Desulfobacterales bacterium]|nr:LysR family transcriptional regulator [Desulfobacterales bacterium]